MKKTLLYFSIVLISLFGCKDKDNSHSSEENSNRIKIEVRTGYEITSVQFNDNGDGVSKKGTGTYYTEERDSILFTDSISFKTNSFDKLNESLNNYKSKPYKGPKRQDASRIEIYFNQDKIYDGYSWNSEFWQIVNPIVQEIPEEINPFMAPVKQE